jgi:translocation and assembly module TamA
MGRAMQVVQRMCTLLAWSGLAPAAFAAVSVDIAGVEDEIREAVLASLSLTQYRDRDISPARMRYLFTQAEAEIERALQPFGFYDPRVSSELEEPGEGEYRASFRVNPGEPVVVTRVDVTVPAPAASTDLVQDALASFELERGARLDHGAYESGKERISMALRATGYLDADLTRHRIAVNTDTNTAEIDLAWDPGPRYRLGATSFSDSQFRPGFLEGYVPWEKGEFYTTDALLTLQQRLVQTQYFETVSVEPLLDERADGVVPVSVVVTPNERNLYTAGIYYSTDFGVGGRLGYERRWLNRRGHKLGVNLEYSQRLEEYSVNYVIPRPSVDDRRYTFGAAYRDEESESSRSQTLRVAAAESRSGWHGFTRTLGLQYLSGDFEVGGDRGSSSMFYAEGTLGRKHYDDLAFPREGYSIDLGLRVAPSAFLSDTSLAQAWVHHKRLLRQGEHARVILRARLGAMTVDDFDELPPELRFFAGGDRSIRGFGYQEIGEVNERGEVIGGKYLATAGAEYEYYLPNRENWGAAIFTDFGDAFTHRFENNISVGVGLRWRSPIGMVRVDVAKPVETRFDDDIGVHITIGPDL